MFFFIHFLNYQILLKNTGLSSKLLFFSFQFPALADPSRAFRKRAGDNASEEGKEGSCRGWGNDGSDYARDTQGEDEENVTLRWQAAQCTVIPYIHAYSYHQLSELTLHYFPLSKSPSIKIRR